MDPSKNPYSTAIVARPAVRISVFSNLEKPMRPTRQPATKTANVAISADTIASITGCYIPINSNRKLPEMPGNSMADIAIAPAKNTVP